MNGVVGHQEIVHCSTYQHVIQHHGVTVEAVRIAIADRKGIGEVREYASFQRGQRRRKLIVVDVAENDDVRRGVGC